MIVLSSNENSILSHTIRLIFFTVKNAKLHSLLLQCSHSSKCDFIHLALSFADQLTFFIFFPQERSNLKDKDILVLPLDLLERASHEAKMKTAIQHFGNVRPLHMIICNNSPLSLFILLGF